MFISESRQHNSLSELKENDIKEEIIGRVTNANYLGFNIEENWKDQYKKVKTKVKSGLSAI